ncbi:hypothetical protein BGZ97_003164, partial [Linnemannia gamsii]
MAPIPPAKRDKIATATLEWLIGDLLPFSGLDSEHFKAMVRAYIPNLAPPCSASIRSSLLKHRLGLMERLKELMERTLIHGAITIDGWSSGSKSFYGITMHWLDADFRMMDCTSDMAPMPFPHDTPSIARL